MTKAVSLAQEVASGVSLGFKNRIINGAMVIDQRNAGASVTQASNSTFYYLDRWFCYSSAGTSRYTVQQNAGAVTSPAGFTKYLGITSLAANSPASGDAHILGQKIEGFNVADFGWGTANAQTITISFRFYSSLTGTFSGAVYNASGARCYPFSYTSSVANTWSTISITVPGDTSGTWATDNTAGLQLVWNLGSGTSLLGTAGAWTGSLYFGATGSLNVLGTSGATFYITGVQLEVGSSATNFEYRDYGRELMMCQRYYETNAPENTAPANNLTYMDRIPLVAFTTSNASVHVPFKVSKRTAPTVTLYSGSAAGGTVWNYYKSNWLVGTGQTLSQVQIWGLNFDVTSSANFVAGNAYISQGGWAASAEL